MAESTTGPTQPSSYRAQGELPLVVHADGNPGVEELVAWLTSQADFVHEQLSRHGAILFRGFDVTEATDFERIARAVD
ncbi:MAG: TauD/TfdA family dioxygenase, partial [Myxococcales bacterium]|nr:TauD/TfdA family dioxygenase [Myxococcales bacterium]